MKSLKADDTIGAMKHFEGAERFDPVNSAYPDAVSSVYYRWFLRTREPAYLSEAVNAEQRAAAASPEDPLRLSQVGFLLGELAEAVPGEEHRKVVRGFSLSALDASLRKDPHSVVAHLRKAEILRRSGDAGESRRTLERLIAFEPNALIAYPKLARLEESESPGKAVVRYRKAVALSRELRDRPLDPSQREIIKIDVTGIERRIEAIERGHLPPRSTGQ